MADYLAADRDASLLKSPGRAEVRHIALDHDGEPATRRDETMFAACRPGRNVRSGRGEALAMPLCEFAAVPAETVHPGGRCQRPGCRNRWPEAYERPGTKEAGPEGPAPDRSGGQI